MNHYNKHVEEISLKFCTDTDITPIRLLQDWVLITTAEHQALHSLGGSVSERLTPHLKLLTRDEKQQLPGYAVGYLMNWMAFKNNILCQTS